jgi:hypothetical protein
MHNSATDKKLDKDEKANELGKGDNGTVLAARTDVREGAFGVL